MSAAARIAAFAVALAAAFAAAAGAGRVVGPLERGGDAHDGTDSAHDAHRAPAAATALPPGLALAANGLRLAPVRTTVPAGRPVPYAFRVMRTDGRPLGAYDVEHERRMHLIVVRRDLTQFQHVHPVLQRNGTWFVTLAPLVPGPYRVFADFSSGGRKTTLGTDLFVPGEWEPLRLPAASVSSGFVRGGYRVSLEAGERRPGAPSVLRFDVRDPHGRRARVGRYLGARGHLVILRAGDLAYLHTHADADELRFETTFPSAGVYRGFLQFTLGGRVQTAPFTLEAAQ